MAQLRFRTVTRIASRALLVAGFAGAAWLMSSATAHAAAPAPTTGSTDRAVVSLTTPVTRTAVDLLGTVLRPQHHASRAASPRIHERVGTISAVLGLLRPLTMAVARPGTGTLADLLAPVTGHPRPTRVAMAPRVAQVANTPAPTVTAVKTERAARTPVRRPAATGHPAVRASGPASESGTRQVPGTPDRTPAPAYPVSGNSGISTTVSGSHLDGGALAAGTPATRGTSADRRGLGATEAAVRLLLAEAPIFSPD